MPYSDDLAQRVRVRMSHLDGLTERPVMSGLGFFVQGKMAVAVLDVGLCVRTSEDEDNPDSKPARPFEFAGRPVRGWVCVPEDDLDETGLGSWVERGVVSAGLSM
jgi:hypothetical protein